MSSQLRIAAFALAWAFTPAGAQTGLSRPLTIAVSHTPLSLPLYVAEAEGFLAAAAVKAKLIDCTGGHRCLKLLFDGEADLATASDSALMFQSFERNDFVLLGTFVSSNDNIRLIGRKDAGVSGPAQLAGKKVGVVRGTASQFFLDSYLLLHDVDPRTLHQIALQPEEMADALRTGRVDAVAAWDPYAYASVDALGANAQVLPPSSVYRLTFNLVAHRRLVGQRDRDLEQLLAAVERAEELIRRQPGRAQAILRARLGVDQRFIDWVWPGLEYRLGLDRSLVKTLESEARWAIRGGYVTGTVVPNYVNFIYAAPLMRVNPMAVGAMH